MVIYKYVTSEMSLSGIPRKNALSIGSTKETGRCGRESGSWWPLIPIPDWELIFSRRTSCRKKRTGERLPGSFMTWKRIARREETSRTFFRDGFRKCQRHSDPGSLVWRTEEAPGYQPCFSALAMVSKSPSSQQRTNPSA